MLHRSIMIILCYSLSTFINPHKLSGLRVGGNVVGQVLFFLQTLY